MKAAFCSLLAAAAGTAVAQVTGQAFGFAAGTTGGGSASPQTPSSLDELVQWLTDSTPRVIMIDRTWDFLESEGTTSEQCCSDDRTTKCNGNGGGQLWIGDSCDGGSWEACTYYNAPRKPIDVASDKSIVGVGDRGVIRGKGFRLRGGVSNVIFQNIHVTELNPQFVWGGDAFTLDGADRVWIDHCKTSLIGRQHMVSGWGAAGHVTVSNHEFDGVTQWSSGCNGKHYWTILFIGESDFYTFANNWVHDVSGRAPHIGTDNTDSTILFHAVNNLFENIGGHAFDIDTNTYSLLEGNFFQNVDTPITSASYGNGGQVYYVGTVDDASGCVPSVQYICEWNRVNGSPNVDPMTSTAALDAFAPHVASLVDHIGVGDVPASVRANAGIGKL